MIEVTVPTKNSDDLDVVLDAEQLDSLKQEIADARELLNGRTVWNINSTAQGGGVAEMLQHLIGYTRGWGIDVRWLVTEGDDDFFAITKRIHNNVHGHPGDGGLLGDQEARHYRRITAENNRAAGHWIKDGDIVICHDPQTAGMITGLKERNIIVLWRCHIGHDEENFLSQRAWQFLEDYLRPADHHVFSRRAYIPPQLAADRVSIIPPSIDPLSPKNCSMDPEIVRAILVKTGIVSKPAGEAQPCFRRDDGSIGLVERCADVVRLGLAPAFDQPLAVQISRWDHLKDPLGVMHGFARHVTDEAVSLVLAGPNVTAVADDPEGGQVLDEVISAWRELPHEMRKRVHIVCLPMTDREENAAIVNALQRHASVIIQKSISEGFGLTVTEGMWKHRPMIASAIGGIQDQMTHEVHGLLLPDPNDLGALGNAIDRILGDPTLAHRLARNAGERVRSRYLFVRHLGQYLRLFEELLTGETRQSLDDEDGGGKNAFVVPSEVTHDRHC